MKKLRGKGGRPLKGKRPVRSSEYEEHWEWIPAIPETDKKSYVTRSIKCLVAAFIVFGGMYQITDYLSEPTISSHKGLKQKTEVGGKLHTAKNSDDVRSIRNADHPKDLNAKTIKSSVTSALVSGNNVLIRENPKINGKVLGKVIFGTSIDVIGYEGKWVQIHSSAQNLRGWTEKISLNF